MSQTVEVLEGMWEEIAIRAEDLKGKRVQVLVFPSAADASNGVARQHRVGNQETLVEAFARVGTISGLPADGSERVKEIWGENVEEKHR